VSSKAANGVSLRLSIVSVGAAFIVWMTIVRGTGRERAPRGVRAVALSQRLAARMTAGFPRWLAAAGPSYHKSRQSGN
jgi:hypothetical protein